jgi:hypothetical protein
MYSKIDCRASSRVEEDVVLNNGEIRWISTNLECPLFLCFVNKKKLSVRIFSCTNLLTALFYRMHPLKATLKPATGRDPNGWPFVHRELDTGNPTEDREGEFDVYLGNPLIDMPLNDFETKADHVFKILKSG